MESRALEERFLRHIRSLGVGAQPERLVVAVSGGCDSVALLYLLRFHARPLPLDLTAAHLDHAARDESACDALWLRGLCAAWGVPLVSHRLASPPRGETDARAARYAFLHRVASGMSAASIVTAHHADDQAETVLFRALRGTGLSGLAGIAARSEGGLVRPLLPFWRAEIESFAKGRGLRWREDASNASLDPVRNRIRLHILPLLEREVAPAARASLVALSALAAEAEAALGRDADRAVEAAVQLEGESILLARAKVRDYDTAIASRMLRRLLRRFGVVLSGTGTRTALQFISDAPSGRELHLPGGVRIRAEFEVARLERDPLRLEEPLVIERPTLEGVVDGKAWIGGRAYRVAARASRWEGSAGPEDALYSLVLPVRELAFPLTLRSWLPGDRVRTAGGTKTLKKLFGERRVPVSTRRRLPVLADASGRVLWIGGIERLRAWSLRDGEEALYLTVAND